MVGGAPVVVKGDIKLNWNMEKYSMMAKRTVC